AASSPGHGWQPPLFTDCDFAEQSVACGSGRCLSRAASDCELVQRVVWKERKRAAHELSGWHPPTTCAALWPMAQSMRDSRAGGYNDIITRLSRGECNMSASGATAPVPLRLSKDGPDRLVIEWDDGHRSVYEWQHLRAHCPCAGCREEREQPPDPFHILKPAE